MWCNLCGYFNLKRVFPIYGKDELALQAIKSVLVFYALWFSYGQFYSLYSRPIGERNIDLQNKQITLVY